MNKATMDTILSTFGNKLVAIKFDNSEMLYVNYKDSPKTSTDVTTTTIGDNDFLIVMREDGYGNKYQVLHDLANVISFVTADTLNGYVDPWILK